MGKSKTRKEKARKEQEAREKLGIHLVRLETVPTKLRKTFEQIENFQNYEISSYSRKAPSTSSQAAWRSETVARANKIAAKAGGTRVEGDASEMEWRVRIEDLVFERLTLEVYCPNTHCGRRIWRSEIEAVVEKPGVIAQDLVDVRDKREPCNCRLTRDWLGKVAGHFNNIFSSRADQLVRYRPVTVSSIAGEDEHSLRNRRPDRVFGFQKTEGFNHRLSEPFRGRQEKTACQQQVNATTISVGEAVKSTILDSKGRPLLFPFLVVEAKKQDGDTHRNCNVQSALPIWKLLQLQEGLHERSRVRLEYGGPLIWYIEFRGDEWCVFACFTERKDGKTVYEGVELWHGNISEKDKALQLLLIVDYIFDWARDIYKASIMGQLRALAKPLQGLEEGEENNMARQTIDDDEHLSRSASIVSFDGDLLSRHDSYQDNHTARHGSLQIKIPEFLKLMRRDFQLPKWLYPWLQVAAFWLLFHHKSALGWLPKPISALCQTQYDI